MPNRGRLITHWAIRDYETLFKCPGINNIQASTWESCWYAQTKPERAALTLRRPGHNPCCLLD
jgi:hypothetical protein